MKHGSTFFAAPVLAIARANIADDARLSAFARAVTARAEPWRAMPDARLWALMFGPTLPRSWMVWSDGCCPACTQSVPMYEWRIDALGQPWKVVCPHCAALFPTNDFGAFYHSGLDAHGVFDPAKADRSLLVNTAHPDPADPLHGFGVDDGTGYGDGARLWRFIGAYLVYGQWKQAVLGGINSLAAAYVVSGDAVYARKAAILLDRVADLYPSFDFKEQAVVYERKLGSNGYVSTWHDACEETRELALAYDMIFAGARDDAALVAFLAGQAAAHGLENPKAQFADIARNIEDGLLRDPLERHPERINSNFPRTENCKAILEAVLDWPGRRDAVLARIDDLVARSTRVDGVTGEKGLNGYTCYTIGGLAQFLRQMTMAEPDLLRGLLGRHPALAQTWRFHVDTYCEGYYPTCGDAGYFASRAGRYCGATFTRLDAEKLPTPPLAPSSFSFFWQLYQATGDPAYAQVMHQANDGATDNLPWDLFCADPAAVRQDVAAVIARHGARFQVGSVNKEAWHLAILRADDGPAGTTAWLDYDWGGLHAHSDGLNLGLFAFGLDLLPDYGYPPVNHGGWDAPPAVWYTKTEAHNTVTVDGVSKTWAETPDAGRTALWADGRAVRAVRATAPHTYADTAQCERALFLVDLAPGQPVLFDIFRVVGGREHLKTVGGALGTLATAGLRARDDAALPEGVLVRHVRCDPAPAPGWHADWAVEDIYGCRAPGADVHLRYTDLSADAEALVGEAWVVPGGFAIAAEAWAPRVMVRRRGASLASTFVGVYEPYAGTPPLARVRRLALAAPDGARFPDNYVAVEIAAADGATGLLLAADVENAAARQPAGGTPRQAEWDVTLDGEAAYLQRDAAGRLTRAALFNGTRVTAADFTLAAPQPVAFVEIARIDGQLRVVAGAAAEVTEA